MIHAYSIESAEVERAVIAAVERQFAVARDAGPTDERTFYDTFGWRLFFDGQMLSLGPDRMLSLSALDGRPILRSAAEADPSFASDLPQRIRDAVGPRIEMRRLSPVVRIELRVRLLRILDSNQKTVVRLAFEHGVAIATNGRKRRHRLPRTISIKHVRGYEKQAARVKHFIERELELSPTDASPLTRALTAVGCEPRPYSGKVRVKLDPEMAAGEATKRILRRLFETMRANEDGLRADVDSEFLHDFRVSVRRTRSAMGQIKRVFPTEEISPFRADFKWLGDLTGPTRDLDVYLLKMPRYRSSLPEALRDDLDPLQRFLVERQRKEHRRLVQGLDTRRYRKLVLDYAAWLDRPVTTGEPAPNAQRPVAEIAGKRIRKAFERVLNDGGVILPESPASLLHQLRIDGKKLRYLVEFFASLYGEAEIKPVVRTLKQLQDNLGDLNDLHVQQESLRAFAGQLSGTSDADENTMIAIGRLVERLAAEEVAERRRFDACFAEFSSKSNLERFRKIVGGKR